MLLLHYYDCYLILLSQYSDFMGMRFFGWLLRNSGAFYIRRSFGDDMLYWAVFTEYIQTQICNGDSPVEFFVEGTRSRTSKSYAPKFGKNTNPVLNNLYSFQIIICLHTLINTVYSHL